MTEFADNKTIAVELMKRARYPEGEVAIALRNSVIDLSAAARSAGEGVDWGSLRVEGSFNAHLDRLVFRTSAITYPDLDWTRALVQGLADMERRKKR